MHAQCGCRLYHLWWLFMALSQSWELFCTCLMMRRNYFAGMLFQMLSPAVLIQFPKLLLAKFFHKQIGLKSFTLY